MINVTKTFFPPLEEYNQFLNRIWKSEWLTNRGQLVLELESELKRYLNVENLLIVNNGTIALQLALHLLGNKGEVITTPFSYIATTSSILWENCEPIFVDIDPVYWTIDENLIERSITDKTTCILATHVFGNPCNIEIIENIAKKHNLFVIYDAAHCFGVSYRGDSIFNYGDISTCSFHATKIFHTGEGGAVFCKDKEIFEKIYYKHNFGHNGPLDFHGIGINAKISELQAAMGLTNFPYLESIISSRREIVNLYNISLNFDRLRKIQIRENTDWNYSYYPVLFESEELLVKIQKELAKNNIYLRRYFYPSLNNLPFVNYKFMPCSENIANTIACLPLYHSLAKSDVVKISEIINNCMK
jgi:dTDP-4-amino-4,6-dideoxygalactose transaminase